MACSAGVPLYWQEACAYLSQKDRVLRRLIAEHPAACLQSPRDAFATLARSIVGQQISVKAAQTVWDKLSKLIKPMQACRLLKLKVEDMRKVGLSQRKVECLVDLALHCSEGGERCLPASWEGMDDAAVIAQLVQIKGIGPWTAEMFLIFHLMRPDVLPLDDVGLLKGISQAYFSGEPVSRSEVRELAKAWQPYRSVATWYIWRSLDPLPVAY